MTVLNISVPDGLKEFVDAEVSKGRYRSPSEYVSALIKEAQKLKTKRDLESMLLAGLKSGEPVFIKKRYWQNKHGRLAKEPLKNQ